MPACPVYGVFHTPGRQEINLEEYYMDETRAESRFFLWRIMDVLERIFCIIPIALMTAIVFISVIYRYVLKTPLGWSEEFTLICMMWSVFGAASYAFHQKINVGVTFLVDRFHGKTRGVIEIVINLIAIIFFVVLLYASSMTLMNVAGKFSLAAHIPLAIPYSAIPYGCVTSILRLLELMFDAIKSLRSPEDGR